MSSCTTSCPTSRARQGCASFAALWRASATRRHSLRIATAAATRQPRRSELLWPAIGARSTSSPSVKRWTFATSTKPRSPRATLESSRYWLGCGPHRKGRPAACRPRGTETIRPMLPPLIHGLGPSLVLKLVGECGTDLSPWPDAKHFTSWLCLAPSNKISGGRVLSSRTRRSGSRAAALLRLAAVTVGRTQTALGAFYRRLSARIGKAKAVTATARKIAGLFYNAVRHGMVYADPGASYYETRYRKRVVDNLHRRARAFGFVLHPMEPAPSVSVS